MIRPPPRATLDRSSAASDVYKRQANALVIDTVCLGTTVESACYGFKLTDSYGDGIIGGNWQLQTTDGKVLLGDDFANGSNSPSLTPAYAGYTGHSFCLPPGPANIASKSCGIFNFSMNSYVYCRNVAGAGSYQFEFSDPDAGFIRRIAVLSLIHISEPTRPY